VRSFGDGGAKEERGDRSDRMRIMMVMMKQGNKEIVMTMLRNKKELKTWRTKKMCVKK